jgi:cytochrome c-type biogenesis protein CcmH/NrfG
MKTFKLIYILLVITTFPSFFSCATVETKSPDQAEFETGLSFFNHGSYANAIPHFEKATELNPELGKSYLYLGRTYMNLGRWREALSPLRTAMRLSPEESRKDIADIIMDIFLQNAARIDRDTESEILDSIKQK